MTPAIRELKKSNIHFTLHPYSHGSAIVSYGQEAAQALGISDKQVFKTLLVSSTSENTFIVAIVPVANQLNLKSLAVVCKVKKIAMANPKKIEKATGYVVGGISPIGQKRKLPTIIDKSALKYTNIYVSAGKRGLQVELSPQDLIAICHAKIADIGH